MTPKTQHDLSRANRGRVPPHPAASDSRPGLGLPAPSRPRPAERAPGTDTALQLAFDSFREPAPAGQRGCHSGDRHLVYLSREYAVDVHLEPGGRKAAVLRGELISRADGPLAEVPAFLLEGDSIAGYACTGSLGEFQLETGDAPELRLCLLLDAERCIDLPLAPPPAAAA